MTSKMPGKVKDIPIDSISPNAWNPQKMDNIEFAMLLESLEEGMLEPILVVPTENTDDINYTILGGEHRWRAAMELGWEEIPAVILTEEKFQSEDLQKFITLRMNQIHGKIDPEKFRDLYEDLSDRYSKDSLQKLMGFTQTQKFNKLVGGVEESLKASGLPKEMVKEFSDVVEEVQSVDDLSDILQNLFDKQGDTLDDHFMIFSHGGKDHIYIKCDKTLHRRMTTLISRSKKAKVDIVDVLSGLLSRVEKLNLRKYARDADE